MGSKKRTDPRCRKLRYRNRALAENAKHRARHRDDELRVYGCPDCGGFHLTSAKTGAIQ